jgi:enoyl-CoA hydratase/carnithine racemase
MLSGEGKAFCAGGDVKSLYLNRKSHPEMLDVFFREEFELDYLLSQMKSIQVSVLDGVVMGGGVGVSIHSKVMIVTEKTVFAMPEARIGFITDVGGSYFLSRIKGRVGFLLAITGKRLSGKEMV